jgi:hypothetical protein
LKGNHSSARSRRVWLLLRSYLASVVLMAAGLSLIIVETPPGNDVVSKTATYELYVRSVSARHTMFLPLTREKEHVESSSAIDLTVVFQMRVKRFPDSTEPSAVVASIGRIQFPLNIDGILSTVGPFVNGAQWLPLLGYIPVHQWQTIKLSATRSHSITYWLDGVQRFSSVLDGPRFMVAPIPIRIGVPKNEFAVIQIRDFRMRVVTFGPARPSQNAALIRVLQFLGALLIVAATALLASRLLRNIAPPIARRRAVLAIIAIGTIAFGIVAELIYEALARPPPEPHDAIAWWLYNPFWRFTDYWQTVALLQSRNPYGIPGGTYPPFGYWILEPFAWMKDYPSLFFAEALFVGFISWLSWSVIGRHFAWPTRIVIALVILCSLPVSFALDRGNIDFLLAALLMIGASALEQRRHYLAAAIYGLAGAAKILPILYLAVFIRRRRLIAFLFGALVAAGITAWAFTTWAPIGTIPTQIKELRTALHFQSQSYLNPQNSTPFNTSITGFVQAVAYALNGTAGATSVAPSAQRYVGLEELIGTILVVLYVVVIERRSWRALTMLTIALLLLPEVSGYYALTYLLAPLLLFARDADVSRRNVFVAILFGVIFAPKAYAFFGTGSPLVDSSVLVTAPLLCALGLLVAFDGIRERGGIRGLIDSTRSLNLPFRRSPAAVSNAPPA